MERATKALEELNETSEDLRKAALMFDSALPKAAKPGPVEETEATESSEKGPGVPPGRTVPIMHASPDPPPPSYDGPKPPPPASDDPVPKTSGFTPFKHPGSNSPSIPAPKQSSIPPSVNHPIPPGHFAHASAEPGNEV